MLTKFLEIQIGDVNAATCTRVEWRCVRCRQWNSWFRAMCPCGWGLTPANLAHTKLRCEA
jgi:hypothetical protein